MKKRHAIAGLGMMLVVFSIFFSGSYTEQEAVYQPEKIPDTTLSEDAFTFWVINDLHYLAPELKEEGEAFDYIRETAAGKDLIYQDEALEALITNIRRRQPDYLLVNGDLTLNGARASAERLHEYFARIEEAGTEVMVIPGNHDLSNGWARRFTEDQQVKVPSLEPADYKELYGDYGFDLAAFQDSHSFSYVVPVRKDYWIVLLDANQYADTTGHDPPPAGGRLREETIGWLEKVGAEAEKAGAKLLPVMHHNALPHNPMVKKNYAIENGSQLIEWLAETNSRVVLTAHIHAQNILKQTSEQHTLYDIATGAFSIYPASIGTVGVDAEGFSYERIMNPVEKWAEETGQTNPDLMNHQAYMRELFLRDGRMFGRSSVYEEQWDDKSRVEEVSEFVGEANTRFFSGADYVPEEKRGEAATELYESSLYRHIEEQSSGRLLRYLESVLLDDNMEDTQLFVPFNEQD